MVTVVIAECLGTITAIPTFEFLRKSVYAAYATLVIVTLLVAKKSAAGSVNPGQCAKERKIVSPDGTQCVFPPLP